jgi:hypothetical protein
MSDNTIEKVGRFIWGTPWMTGMAKFMNCRVDHIQDCKQGRRRLHPEQWRDLHRLLIAKAAASVELSVEVETQMIIGKHK